ncbi:hypothetical protein ACN47E_002144 [Coniothyrium glycines]
MSGAYQQEVHNEHMLQSSNGSQYTLCQRCREVDIENIWSTTKKEAKTELGPISSWNPNSCGLCKFFRDVLMCGRLHNQGTDVSASYHLYSMHTRNAYSRLLQTLSPRIIVLSDAEHGHPRNNVPYIAANPGSSSPPRWLRPVPPLIDVNQPKKWLQICSHLHSERCGKLRRDPVPYLKLIDCKTKEVVWAQANDTYVALSYVWGKGKNTATSTYPKTVLDAIKFTQALGYNLLWVDQYCIDQSNTPEVEQQLQQMDAIYKEAVVTLIAAAGGHADYGLVGVSRERQSAPSVVVPQGYLSALRGIPDMSDINCTWTTRAWTYQEGLLSSKRLVFTESQLYFECQGLYCMEMLDISVQTWEDMHHHDAPHLKAQYRAVPHMGIFPLGGCGVNPWEIGHRINEYSQRTLTFKADILKGILGILKAFERNKNPMRHLYGIAFPQLALLSPNATQFGGSSKSTLPTFSESLRWTLQEPSMRRDGFPSWSWTGWYGIITWPNEYNDDGPSPWTPRRLGRPRDPQINENQIQISIELHNGETVDWFTFQQHYHEISIANRFSGILSIQAWTTPVAEVHDEHMFGLRVHLGCENGGFARVVAQRTTTATFESRNTLLALHFWQTSLPHSNVATDHFLVIVDQGDHWERVAIGAYRADASAKLVRTWRTLRLG